MEKLRPQKEPQTPLNQVLTYYEANRVTLEGLAFMRGAVEPEHAVQDAVMNMIRVRETLTDANIPAYLRQSVRNKALDQLRYEKRRPKEPIEIYGHEKSKEAGVDEVVIQKDVANKVHEAVENLTDKYRDVIKLVYFDSMSYAETAEILGIAIGTVKSRLNLGIHSLRALINQDGSLDRDDLSF